MQQTNIGHCNKRKSTEETIVRLSSGSKLSWTSQAYTYACRLRGCFYKGALLSCLLSFKKAKTCLRQLNSKYNGQFR